MALTLYRRLTHKELGKVTLKGRVLDLGGSKKSEYWRCIKGEPQFTFVNMDSSAEHDVTHDLEKTPYPFEDMSFDGVLAVNVLEHMWHWQGLIAEACRVLVSGGRVVIVVPFLHAVHPSPHDFFRFTDEALLRALKEAGFTDIAVEALGTGVFAARFSLMQRFIPGFLTSFFGFLAEICDALLTRMCRMLGKRYVPSDYPLGYMATALKR